jgi:hypothetical protein
MSYSEQLARELAEVGIDGSLRRRIVAEIDDHLSCDPAADLGDPRALARRFADELGTRRAVRACFSAFAALAVAGTLLLAALLAAQSAGGFATRVGQGPATLGELGFALIAFAGQVALIAGTLGAVRALRRRRSAAISRREALVLVRRAWVALLAGAVTMAGLALLAIGFDGHIASWWTDLAPWLAAAGLLALSFALPALRAARRLAPQGPGGAGDLADDLDGLVPARVDVAGWGFALAIAGAVAAVITLAGAAAGDPYDGALRGLADAAACLAVYAALGRFLGLRRAQPD